MNRALVFWSSTIGKKVVMAVTGIFMVAWILGHVSGNLLVFKGSEAMNAYAAFLHSLGGMLWGVRIALLVSVVLHATAAIQLTMAANAARPQAYVKKKAQTSTLASQLMRIGGLILLAYIVFHILHLTVGAVHPQFSEKDVYRNLVIGLKVPWVSAFYIVAMAALGMHLFHGVWSSARTLGIARPTPRPLERRIAVVLAVVVWAGFTLIPVAVLAGIVS
jgi:succinate dehydrogenase / fumarate reductase cytochrome b subunit